MVLGLILSGVAAWLIVSTNHALEEAAASRNVPPGSANRPVVIKNTTRRAKLFCTYAVAFLKCYEKTFEVNNGCLVDTREKRLEAITFVAGFVMFICMVEEKIWTPEIVRDFDPNDPNMLTNVFSETRGAYEKVFKEVFDEPSTVYAGL